MNAMNFRTLVRRPRFRIGVRAAELGLCLGVVCACQKSPVPQAGRSTSTPAESATVQQKVFGSPEEASDALILAAEQFDVAALKAMLGPDGEDLVVTEDTVQDKNQLSEFAAEGRAQSRVVRDPDDPKVATLSVGIEDWPLPIPIVEEGGKWRFDSAAGREELLYRRIGRNELDAIEVCRGYVEAQFEYAAQKHDGALVNQYAQRIVSTPGKQDGLAWQAPDGAWLGPVGEGIARVIADGYTDRLDPYHGYFFKILKGQGPAAPMGQMDFVVKGAMIGGFALVAAPADYGVSGVKTFIVAHTGVVYEKDLGPQTIDEFRAMDRFNPDSTWSPVEEP